jgi:hypothetical protein
VSLGGAVSSKLVAARRQAPAEMCLLVQARSRLSWVSQSRKVTALVVSQNRDSKLTGANSRNISNHVCSKARPPPSAPTRGHFKHASRRRHRRYVRTELGALGFQRCPNASRRGRAVLSRRSRRGNRARNRFARFTVSRSGDRRGRRAWVSTGSERPRAESRRAPRTRPRRDLNPRRFWLDTRLAHACLDASRR